MSVIDTSDDTSALVPDLVARGVTAIGRYYSRKAWKRATAKEAKTIASHGIDLFMVFEDSGSPALTRDQGKADAQTALAQAAAIGQPSGSAIYFALEGLPGGYDTQAVPGARDYLRGASEGVGGRYALGIYSDGLLCRTFLDEGLCQYSWLSASRGFPGSREFYASARWNLAQDPHIDQNWSGLSVDVNERNGDIGAFRAKPPDVAPQLVERTLVDVSRYSFSGEPSLRWLTEPGDDRRMTLLEDFWFDDGDRKWMALGKETIVDGASIPRALWTLVGSPYTGDYRRASIVHDVACVEAAGSAAKRRLADRMFYRACRAGGCSPARAALLYLGVRIGAYAGMVPAWRGAFNRTDARVDMTAAEARLAADYRLAGERLLRSGTAEADDLAELEVQVDLALESVLDLQFALADETDTGDRKWAATT